MKENLVVSIDECGAGCLYGDLVVCATLMDSNIKSEFLVDSKHVKTVEKRAEYCEEVKKLVKKYVCVKISPEVIDKVNILNARHLGFTKAIIELGEFDVPILIDGNSFKWAKTEPKPNVQMNIQTIIGGDDHVPSIGGASIIGKHFKDEMIKKEVEENPVLKLYGIDKHSGYGSSDHMNAIKTLGYTERHRKSFNPVKTMFKEFNALTGKEKTERIVSEEKTRQEHLDKLLSKESLQIIEEKKRNLLKKLEYKIDEHKKMVRIPKKKLAKTHMKTFGDILVDVGCDDPVIMYYDKRKVIKLFTSSQNDIEFGSLAYMKNLHKMQLSIV